LRISRRAKIAILGVLAAALVLAWARAVGPLRSPQDALDDFVRAEGRAEDQLTDPLVLAGPRVRPLVLAAVQDRHFRLRRYGIGYLGCAGYRPASPTFRTILHDESEEDYFRADALEALWSSDPKEGHALASAYSGRSDFLGQVARGILTGTRPNGCRSLTDALLHRHY
jgi:hypothetical protein